MARKKAAVAETPSSETPTGDIFDQAIAAQNQVAAQAVVEQVAESTRIPDQEPARPETNPPARTHAEAVGKREFKPIADPFGIASDYLAGVHLSESRRFGKMLIAFDEKPSADVTAKLRDGGFSWEPREKVWTRELRDNPLSVRIKADELFNDVSKHIRTERGITHGHGVSAG